MGKMFSGVDEGRGGGRPSSLAPPPFFGEFVCPRQGRHPFLSFAKFFFFGGYRDSEGWTNPGP